MRRAECRLHQFGCILVRFALVRTAGLLAKGVTPDDDLPDLGAVLQWKRPIFQEPMNPSENNFNCIQIILHTAWALANTRVLRWRWNHGWITRVGTKSSGDGIFNNAR